MSNTIKQDLVPLRKLEATGPVPLSRATLQRWCKSGLLKGRKIGCRWFVNAEEFRRLVEGEHV